LRLKKKKKKEKKREKEKENRDKEMEKKKGKKGTRSSGRSSFLDSRASSVPFLSPLLMMAAKISAGSSIFDFFSSEVVFSSITSPGRTTSPGSGVSPAKESSLFSISSMRNKKQKDRERCNGKKRERKDK